MAVAALIDIDWSSRVSVLRSLITAVNSAGGSLTNLDLSAGEIYPNWLAPLNKISAAVNALGASPQLKLYNNLDYSAFKSVVSDIINAINSVLTPPFYFPVGATALFSTRKIVSAYAGKCVNVRRISDNAATDIGFAGNDFDIASTKAFMGVNGSLYVTKWYDQSGHGFDAVQATANNQPQLLIVGNRVYISFSWYDFYTMQVLGVTGILSSAPAMSVGCVITNGSDLVQIPVCDVPSGWFMELNNKGSGTNKTVGNQPGSYNFWATGYTSDADKISISPSRVLTTISSGNMQNYLNGVAMGTQTGAVINPSSSNGFNIGGFVGNGFNSEGLIGEIFVYPNVLSGANLSAIDVAEASYFPDLGFGTPYISGGHSVQFGNGENISCGNILNYERTQPWTIWAPVQLYNNGGVATVISTNVPPTGGAFPGWELWINPKGLCQGRIMHDIGGGNYIGIIGTTNVVDGKKHMLAMTYDGSSTVAGVKIYVDGVLETTTTESDTLTGSIIGSGQTFIIGSQAGSPDFNLRGTLGLYQVDNVARSPSYIAAHSIPSSLPPIDANTALSYHFTEGSGVTVHDGSSGANNGTLTSATMWV